MVTGGYGGLHKCRTGELPWLLGAQQCHKEQLAATVNQQIPFGNRFGTLEASYAALVLLGAALRPQMIF